MSTLTKIFVVLTLLLSIAYCVAAAFLYTYSEDYKKKFDALDSSDKQSLVEIDGITNPTPIEGFINDQDDPDPNDIEDGL